MGYKKNFIEFMIRSGVLTFGEFITKSGRKTPYFINTGNYRTGTQLARLGEFYADCIMENIKQRILNKNITALFGPAYKGIPISVTTAIALAEKHGMDINYCSNRKEEKDHGEGGSLLGYQLLCGDSVLIVEDVITAGTAMKECVPMLKTLGVSVEGLIISVDRMERGAGSKTAIQELKEEYGIETYPIITINDILDWLYNGERNGSLTIDPGMIKKIEDYMDQYCV
ncbi:MAG: orotate phosphoribosyltransferase [Eubacteriales bacterium]|nr:orotate phosphoribosyltransferase [Eubacteriales bacterium]